MQTGWAGQMPSRCSQAAGGTDIEEINECSEGVWGRRSDKNLIDSMVDKKGQPGKEGSIPT